MSSDSRKLILVIGATGAQGIAVIDKLLAPSSDGSRSPYSIRALTRDPDNQRARELTSKGVECVQGRFDDFASVARALQGAYGAWVNTDGFTVSEAQEVWCGIRIFELAKQAGIRHYVWSNLDYVSKLTNYNPAYKCAHHDNKGRVADFLQAQPSVVSDTELSWTLVTTSPYMDMLRGVMFHPVKAREDGTAVFATPIGQGHVPMIALSDLGFFARYTFDNRSLTSGKDLKVASDWVGWEYLKSTFEKVTGQRAEVIYQTIDEWFENLKDVDHPLANEQQYGDGTITWRENFTAWWSMWRNDIIKKDWEWIRKVNPNGHTLESWMKAENYGQVLWQEYDLLKNVADGKSVTLNTEKVALL